MFCFRRGQGRHKPAKVYTLKTASVKVLLSHIFCNKKLVAITMLNFLFEVGH